MLTRYFALLCGVVFTIVGVLGFIPAFSPPAGPEAPELVVPANYGYLLGLFPVNLLHNLIHLAIGVLGFAAWRSYAAARTFARSLAIYLGILALMGLAPPLHTAFGLVPLYSHDVWLHGLEALPAVYFGFVARQDTSPRAIAFGNPSPTEGDETRSFRDDSPKKWVVLKRLPHFKE